VHWLALPAFLVLNLQTDPVVSGLASSADRQAAVWNDTVRVTLTFAPGLQHLHYTHLLLYLLTLIGCIAYCASRITKYQAINDVICCTLDLGRCAFHQRALWSHRSWLELPDGLTLTLWHRHHHHQQQSLVQSASNNHIHITAPQWQCHTHTDHRWRQNWLRTSKNSCLSAAEHRRHKACMVVTDHCTVGL